MTSINGLECQVATEADYEEVLNIDRNIYNGDDYIPQMYLQYVKDPSRLCYVAIKDKCIVSMF